MEGVTDYLNFVKKFYDERCIKFTNNTFGALIMVYFALYEKYRGNFKITNYEL